MRIFYDTEFTDLSAWAELLSAGFVTEAGQEFYIEFDGVGRHECSDFVLDVVYPMLRAPGVQVATPLMAAQRILEWLSAQSNDVELISDSNWDSFLLGALFHQLQKSKDYSAAASCDLALHYRYISHRDSVTEKVYLKEHAEYFDEHPGMLHHALHDARAIARGVLRSEGFY